MPPISAVGGGHPASVPYTRVQSTRVTNSATCIEDMDLPGYRLHPLKGQLNGHWAINVSGNWRIVFRFKDGDAYVVNYEDYH